MATEETQLFIGDAEAGEHWPLQPSLAEAPVGIDDLPDTFIEGLTADYDLTTTDDEEDDDQAPAKEKLFCDSLGMALGAFPETLSHISLADSLAAMDSEIDALVCKPSPPRSMEGENALPVANAASSVRPRPSPLTIDTHRSVTTSEAASSGTLKGGSRRASSVGSLRSFPSSRRANERVTVHVRNAQTSDTICLNIQCDIKVGPGLPPIDSRLAYSLDVNTPPANSVQLQQQTLSLKEEIEHALGIQVSQQRLFFKNSPMGSDWQTLRSYGVSNGSTVNLQVRTSKKLSMAGCGVVLACTAKRRAMDEKMEEMDRLGRQQYSVSSAAGRKAMEQRCSRRGATILPKWVSQENPNLFAPLGIGLDGHGYLVPFQKFNERPVFHSDPYNAGSQRVRSCAAYVRAR
jgi:hypothetical protein